MARGGLGSNGRFLSGCEVADDKVLVEVASVTPAGNVDDPTTARARHRATDYQRRRRTPLNTALSGAGVDLDDRPGATIRSRVSARSAVSQAGAKANCVPKRTVSRSNRPVHVDGPS